MEPDLERGPDLIDYFRLADKSEVDASGDQINLPSKAPKPCRPRLS